MTGEGPLRVDVPRDRKGSFEPLLIPKHERRFTAFDDKIIAMYARGMTMREIQGFLQESYGVEVSPEFISSVTEAVMAEVTAWQARPLEPMYPVVFFDALRVKIKEDAVVRNKAIYLALGVQRDGTRDILGLWIEGSEGAKFWMKVFNDLKTRGVNDILIAVTDGLKGMPEALGAVFPATTLQTCIVHLIRNSLDYASWKDRKALAAALKPIYTAANAEAAQAELDAFEQSSWGQKFPTVAASWRRVPRFGADAPSAAPQCASSRRLQSDTACRAREEACSTRCRSLGGQARKPLSRGRDSLHRTALWT